MEVCPQPRVVWLQRRKQRVVLHVLVLKARRMQWLDWKCNREKDPWLWRLRLTVRDKYMFVYRMRTPLGVVWTDSTLLVQSITVDDSPGAENI